MNFCEIAQETVGIVWDDLFHYHGYKPEVWKEGRATHVERGGEEEIMFIVLLVYQSPSLSLSPSLFLSAVSVL